MPSTQISAPKLAKQKQEAYAPLVMETASLQHLFDALRKQNYQLLGPRLQDGAITYDEIHSVGDLPIGWTDEQEAGSYRVRRAATTDVSSSDPTNHATSTRSTQLPYFDYNVGPHSWKKFLHPPVVRLWHASREERNATGRDADGQEPTVLGGDKISVHDDTPEPARRAFIGVRACELSGIEIQDKVFLDGPFVDAQYAARRDNLFIVAVNCGRAGATCFCASVGSGPRAEKGFDLSLTEVLNSTNHYFVVETGSAAGREIMAQVPHRAAGTDEIEEAEHKVAAAAQQMGRMLETEGLKEILYASVESPQWEEIAQRCLTCGNCTVVCPTCFCTTVEDTTDLAGLEAERVRKWDSCFTTDFSYIHGGSVRLSPRSRYRQWMTHKLASWQDQFGSLGCVGCGRCITWCPAGIDITEEAARLRDKAASSVT